jgi:hypothetical protein
LKVEGVVSLPGLSSASSCLVVSMTLAQTTRLLASSGETPGFAMLVDGIDDPVDARITADGLMLRVNEDDFEVLVGGVLVDPVRVQNAQVGATTSNTLLSSRLERSLVLELVHTLVGRLACRKFISEYSIDLSTPKFHTVCSTLWYWPLATSTADTNTVDNIALLGLVTQSACFIRTRRAGSTVDDVQLSELYYALSANVQRVYSKEHLKRCPHSTSAIFQYVRRRGSKYWFGFEVEKRVELSYLPAADTEKEAQDIGLLLLVKL